MTKPSMRCLNCRSCVTRWWPESGVVMGECTVCGQVYLRHLLRGNAVTPGVGSPT